MVIRAAWVHGSSRVHCIIVQCTNVGRYVNTIRMLLRMATSLRVGRPVLAATEK
jgi:hypothetical protein